MSRKSDKISPVEAKEALLRSGYLLEVRVASILRNFDFKTNINYSLPDKNTSKPREVDIIAFKDLRTEGDENLVNIHFNLCIECANNPQPLVIFQRKDSDNPVLQMNRYFKTYGSVEYFYDSLGMQRGVYELNEARSKFLHQASIGTQYCSFKKKQNKDEWMAYHEDTHFNTFSKMLDVDLYYRNRFGPPNMAALYVHAEIFSYILIIDGELNICKINKRGFELIEKEYGQLTFSQENSFGLNVVTIHITTENGLPRLIKELEKEVVGLKQVFLSNANSIMTANDQENKGSDPWN